MSLWHVVAQYESLTLCREYISHVDVVQTKDRNPCWFTNMKCMIWFDYETKEQNLERVGVWQTCDSQETIEYQVICIINFQVLKSHIRFQN